jgi:periplasmic protein TonB
MNLPPPPPGVFRPGSGVNLPRVTKEVKPQYTAAAMRAKIQGAVLIECVVNKDGTVSNVRVIRSLDTTYGLDEEAITAANSWLFEPGTRNGEPVPVLISIELTFTLRK